MGTSDRTTPDWVRPRHPRTTLAELLAASIRDHRGNVAIAAPGRDDLTYADVGRAFAAIAGSLADAGYARGARIGLALPDGPELAVVMPAICSVATCAPLNAALDEEALVRLLKAMRIDALIVPARADSVAARAARRAAVALIGLRGSLGNPDGFDLVPESSRGRAPIEAPQAHDIALLIHTSGSTGAPKVVPWEQWRVAEVVRNRIEISRIDASDRSMIALPLHSSAGIRRVLTSLATGGSIACPGALAPDAMLDLLEALAPTHYFAPPASLIALLEACERRVPRLHHRLKTIWSGTTDVPASVRSRLEQAFEVPVLVGYGSTEAGSIAQTPFPPDRAPAGSVGRATNVEIHVADDEGRRLGPGESGEIVVRGAEVFAGYENDDAANRAAFRDGWFRTGDIGRVDRDGFVYVLGRLADIIDRGGTKIASGEIEAVLLQHPQVLEAAAFAVPHRTLGQDVAAAVVLRDRVGASELRHFLRGSLAAFKIPSRIVEVPALPRGDGGKVARGELAALVATMADPGDEPPIGREETEIARIFSDVLRAPRVGRRDSFFDLGGDSLSAANVLTALDAALGVSVSLEVLFDAPTVCELAAALRDRARLDGAHSETKAQPKIERRS